MTIISPFVEIQEAFKSPLSRGDTVMGCQAVLSVYAGSNGLLVLITP